MIQSPTIVTEAPRLLVGLRARMSLAEGKIPAQWESFMPRHREILERVGKHFVSVECYDADTDIRSFTPHTQFEKWATVEVSDLGKLPTGMEGLSLPGGQYAVFVHKGPATDFYKTANYIFQEWFPKSDFEVDDRPHYEIMGNRYFGPHHPESEEDVYVPIRPRKK